MAAKLDFRQPKKSNSSRKRERLLADRRRKAVEKLQDENKNLKRKTGRLYKQLQRKKKKNSTISSRTTSLSASSVSGSTSESSSFQNQSEATTPRSKVDAEIIPFDSIGGTSKRLAEEAVKQEKVSIQGASDFMKWAKESQVESAIKFLFVDKKNTEEIRAFLMAQSENLKPVKSTMKIHSVFSPAVNEIWAREVSCYCLNYFYKTFQPLSLCEGWKEHCLSREVISRATKLKALPAAQLQCQPGARRNKDADAKLLIDLKDEDFVAAVNSEDCQVYIGKVLPGDPKSASV